MTQRELNIYKTGREEMKLPLFTDVMNAYVEKPKEVTKKNPNEVCQVCMKQS